MPEKKVQRIEKIQFANMGYKAVGIYARVSTCLPSQLHSMAMQVSALTHQVYRLPYWSLADIYMDFASGAGVDNRSEFQRMINDCVNGKIELVLTKSISRFGRDTVDGLSAIRELKAHGVEVYFDLEELHSFQPDFELQYSIRAAIAQGEREDFHDSIVLAMNQKVTDGTSSIYSRPCYGYRKTEDDSLTIIPEEAENVRLIFELYLSGKSIVGIMREMAQRNILSPTGKSTWSRRAIDTLLSNEKYRGNSTASTARMSGDPHSKPRDKYLYQGHHEAIVDEKTFIAVAEEKKRRSNIESDENGIRRKKTRYVAKAQTDEQDKRK